MICHLFFSLLVFFGPAALATEIENPNFMPFGEQEAYLGNAGIAFADSSGAVYYNPGALGFTTERKASVYGNAYAFNNYSNKIPIGNGAPDFVFSSNSYMGVPLSSVTIFGGSPWTYAFSVNMPYSAQTSSKAKIEVGNANLNITQDTSEGSLWIGPTVARRLSDRWSVGASLFAARFYLNTNMIIAVNGGSNESTSTARASINDWALLTVLGVQFRASEVWAFGLRVQSPSLEIRGRTDYFSVDVAKNGKQTITDEADIHSRYRRPFQVGIGTQFSPSASTVILFDLNAQLPVHFDSAPSRPLVNNRVDTEFRMRANLGVKTRLGATHYLLGGLMYNPSTEPDRKMDTFTLAGVRESFRGVTMGLQKDLGALTTNVGGFYLWSKSEITIASRSDVAVYRHQVYGLLLTASYKL